jgi:hypothetical protein
MSIFIGKVCSGRGIATGQLDALRPQFDQHLGSPPAPGTLNVLLDGPVNLHLAHASIIIPKCAFWLVKFNGIDTLAYRWQHCPLHVVEIVSHLPLRNHFGLQDGAPVELDLGGAIAATPLTSKVCWWLLWRGRERLFYSSNSYDRRLLKYLARIARRASQDIDDIPVPTR